MKDPFNFDPKTKMLQYKYCMVIPTTNANESFSSIMTTLSLAIPVLVVPTHLSAIGTTGLE
jgi:hypothetical protein